jgi:hypothetical protein
MTNTASFANGQVKFVNADEGRPAYFEVSFVISSRASALANAPSTYNFFRFSTVVPAEESLQSYFEVEALAAGQLAPELRALADLIEERVDELYPPPKPVQRGRRGYRSVEDVHLETV